MSRNAMKISLSLSIMTVLLLGYSNCSSPKYEDSGVNPYASISDPDNAIEVSPAGQTVGLNETLQLSVKGGTPPYRFSLVSGGGSIDTYSGIYTASNVDSDAVINVQDVTGKVGQAYVKVSLDASTTLSLSYTPAGTVNVNSQLTLSASGGTAPYTYFMYSGVGSVSSNKYSATSFGTAVIGVRDANQKISTFSISVGSQVPIVTKPIYRLYNSSAKQYLFSKTTTEGTGQGYVLQSSTAAFKVLQGTYLSSAQLLRCYIASNGGRYLTASGSCGAYTNEGSLGVVWTYQAPNSIALYNCFKPSTGSYLSTTDYSTCVNNGYNVQSPVIGYVPQ